VAGGFAAAAVLTAAITYLAGPGGSALAAGVTVGAGLLAAFGVPDRRMGCAGVAPALRVAGPGPVSLAPPRGQYS
jgi:hypothetical protein